MSGNAANKELIADLPENFKQLKFLKRVSGTRATSQTASVTSKEVKSEAQWVLDGSDEELAKMANEKYAMEAVRSCLGMNKNQYKLHTGGIVAVRGNAFPTIPMKYVCRVRCSQDEGDPYQDINTSISNYHKKCESRNQSP